MLTGLTSWIFGDDSSDVKAQDPLEEPEVVERHCPVAPSRGRRRSTVCKSLGNSWHGDYPSHLYHWGHEQRRVRNQGSKHGRPIGSRKGPSSNGSKDKDSKKGLNDEGWVWVCDEKENEPTPEAFEHDYAWYALEDQIDLNTISIHNEWQIAPPSCFTGTPIPEEKLLTTRTFDIQEKNNTVPIGEVSIFENLLIEHPSMSIYDKFPERAANLQRLSSDKEAKSQLNINEPAIDDQSLKFNSPGNERTCDDGSHETAPDLPIPSRSALKQLLNYIIDDESIHIESSLLNVTRNLDHYDENIYSG